MTTPKLETPSFSVDHNNPIQKVEVNTYRQAAHDGLNSIIENMVAGKSRGGEDWTVCQDTGHVFRLTYCEVSNPKNTHVCDKCNGTGLRTTHRDISLN